MKTKIKIYFFSLILLLAGTAGMQAQMTIGNSAPPHGGALLDLQQPNASTKMGLKLPTVTLADATQYGLTSGEPATATGMVVYNDNPNIANGHGVGVYVWDGAKWNSLLGNGSSTGETTVTTVKVAGMTWMARNLGVSASEVPKPTSYYNPGTNASPTGSLNGDYYQWGRIADGHEKWDSFVVMGPTSTEDDMSQVPETSGAYGKFVTATISKRADWRVALSDNLWNETETGPINPCPSGFRIPTASEWNLCLLEIEWSDTLKGWIGKYPYTTDIFLPATGTRLIQDGTFSGVGSSAQYWTSSVQDSYAVCASLLKSYNGSKVGSIGRAFGSPVRCVKS